MKIYKQILPPLGGVSTFGLSHESKIVHVALDPAGMPCLWFMFEPTEQTTTDPTQVTVECVGTGWDFAPNSKHLGSIVVGDLVFHYILLT